MSSQRLGKSEDDSDSKFVGDDDGSYMDDVSSQSQISDHASASLGKKRRKRRKAYNPKQITGEPNIQNPA